MMLCELTCLLMYVRLLQPSPAASTGSSITAITTRVVVRTIPYLLDKGAEMSFFTGIVKPGASREWAESERR